MSHNMRRFGLRNYSQGLAIECLERRDMLSGTPPRVTGVEVGSTNWSPAFTAHLQSTGLGVNAYAIPKGSAAQSATLTWTHLDQIFISFSEDVQIQANNLSVSGVNVTAYEFIGFHYDPQTYTARWTLATPIDNDRLCIDLDAGGSNPVRDLDGNVLDGEWTNNVSTVSGNGVAGGDFEFYFAVLPTDVNNSANITNYDYLLIKQLNGQAIGNGAYQAKRDINGDGVITSDDWQEALDRAFERLPDGTAVGMLNDAPTAGLISLIQLNDLHPETSISLLSAFGDLESGSSGLTYSIVSNSDDSLVDAWIDQETQELHFATASAMASSSSSPSGRATVTVRATDSEGLFVETKVTVDVNRENQPPVITDFSILEVAMSTYIVSGYVSDPDDDVSSFIVSFSGVFTTRAAVSATGYFEFAIILEGNLLGLEYAITSDPHGAQSNQPQVEIVLT